MKYVLSTYDGRLLCLHIKGYASLFESYEHAKEHRVQHRLFIGKVKVLANSKFEILEWQDGVLNWHKTNNERPADYF